MKNLSCSDAARAEKTAEDAVETSNVPFAAKEICVSCGEPTRAIPRFDYTAPENKENDWKFPEGGYICESCEDDSYSEAHHEGNRYCPQHGFVAGYLNSKNEQGEFIGCFDGCQDAVEYDRTVREKGAGRRTAAVKEIAAVSPDELSAAVLAAYLKSPHTCPYCGSEELDASKSSLSEGGKVFQPVVCHDCRKRWYDIYSLCGIREISD